MEFSPTLLAIVPPLLAIVLAVITRQVVLSLFIAVFVGAVMLCGGNLWEGFYSTFFDYILPGFEDTDHQRILALTPSAAVCRCCWKRTEVPKPSPMPSAAAQARPAGALRC